MSDAKLMRELCEVLGKIVDDSEQSRFEDWLEATRPSGDCESVEYQWRESSAYSVFAEENSAAIEVLAKAGIDGSEV